MKDSPAQIVHDRLCGDARRYALAVIIALAGSAGLLQAQAPQGPTLSLRAVLDSVVRHYPLVLAAQARVRAAQGSRVTAGAFANPIVGYQVDDNVGDVLSPAGSLVRVLEPERVTTVTLPLEPLYQRGARVKRANAEVRAAVDDAIAARQRAALAATQVFYRTALAQVRVATARNLLVWLDSLVTYNRSRVKEGAAAEADLIRTQLERDRAAADATVEDADLAQARADLAAYVGVSPSVARSLRVTSDVHPLLLPRALVTPTGSMSTLGAATGSVSNLGAASEAVPQTGALGARAEVRAARERVAATSASISSERSLILRQLGVTFGVRQTAGTTSMIAGVNLPVPLFDQNRGEIERARADREAAGYELAAQERSVSAEVTGAYQAARLLTARATAMAGGTQDFLARADEARRIALGAYREGAVPLFQVIDAARAWNDARLAYYRTLYAQQQSVLALVVAEGGDLLVNLPAVTAPVAPNR